MIVAGDLASAELRVIATLAKDKPLLTAFANGENIHLKNAREIFGPSVQKGDDIYTLTKSAIYRFCYLLPNVIPADLGQLRATKAPITPEMLDRLYRGLARQHIAIENWKRVTIAELLRTHKARNVFGRYRDLSWGLYTWDKGVKDHCCQAALNFQVQSAIAKIVNRALVRLDDWFNAQQLQGWMCLQVHDEITCFTPDQAEVLPIAQAIKTCVEVATPELGGLVIPCELKVGPNWGSVKEFTI